MGPQRDRPHRHGRHPPSREGRELDRGGAPAGGGRSPPVVKGRRPNVPDGTPAAVAPPSFVFVANGAALIHRAYRRYLESRLREEFGFDGTPIKLVFRDRESARL